MVKNIVSKYKRILLIIISSFILVTIYRQFKWLDLFNILKEANIILLISGCLLTILLGYLSSIRYSYFSSKIIPNDYPGISTSLKSYFVASSLNLLLPSKLGDLSKGFISERIDSKKYPQSLHIFTLYEKGSDLLALLLIAFVISFIMILINISTNLSLYIPIPLRLNFLFLIIIFSLLNSLFFILAPKDKQKIPKYLQKNSPKKIIEILNFNNKFEWQDFYSLQFYSTLIWVVHISQMLFFAASIGIPILNLSVVFVIIFSVLIGLLPLSFAGIGTRDASLVYFLAPVLGDTKPLILGVLLTSRYIIPAIFGLIFLQDLKGQTKIN